MYRPWRSDLILRKKVCDPIGRDFFARVLVAILGLVLSRPGLNLVPSEEGYDLGFVFHSRTMDSYRQIPGLI